jgi:hypothetical protein
VHPLCHVRRMNQSDPGAGPGRSRQHCDDKARRAPRPLARVRAPGGGYPPRTNETPAPDRTGAAYSSSAGGEPESTTSRYASAWSTIVAKARLLSIMAVLPPSGPSPVLDLSSVD